MPDLQRLRADFAYFAHVARGEPLAGWQSADLSAGEPFLLLLWGRQMGKSLSLALRSLWRAYATAGCVVLIVSGSGELGSRRIMREARLIAARSPVLSGSTVDEQAGLLRLSNGSEIRSVAASEGSIRGWAASELLLDEAHLIPDDLALGAALPTVSAREGAQVVAAGTASVASGWWFDLCRRAETGEEGLRLSRRVSRLVSGEDAAPWQNPTIVEAQVRAMGPLRADAEHRCIWSSGADAFVDRQTLDRATADFLPASLDSLHGPARVAGGVDWGWRRDRSALVAVARVAGHDRFAVCLAHRWERAAPLPQVVEDIVASPAHFHAVTPELNGLGGPWAERLHARIRQRAAWAGGAHPGRGFRVVAEDPADPLLARGLAEPRKEPREITEFLWPPPDLRAGTAALQAWVNGGGARTRPRRRRTTSSSSFATSVRGVHVSAPLKAGAYGSLRRLLEEQSIVFPASAAELRAELLGLRVTLTEAGEKIEGASDDLCDALMLALRPVKFRDGRYGTALGLLADPRRRLPGPDLPGGWSRGEDVETASGVRVPREPAWQSVEGSECSVPGAPPPTGEDLEKEIPLMRRAP